MALGILNSEKMNREGEDDAVQDAIASTTHLEEQIDKIAEIRGWFNSDQIPAAIIKRYMSGSLNIDQAVNQLAEPIDEAYTSIAKHSAEGLLWNLWYGILHMSKKIPWDDDVQQNRLVDLVKALKARPDPPLPIRRSYTMQTSWIYKPEALWSVLTLFGPSVRETWNDIPGCGAGLTTIESIVWANTNAFIARLTIQRVTEFWSYGIFALRDALEEKLQWNFRGTTKDTWSAIFPAAVAWIKIAGRDVWEWLAANDDDEEAVYDASIDIPKGLPYDGRRAYTRARWQYWRERLELIASSPARSDKVRTLANDCASFMKQVEGASL